MLRKRDCLEGIRRSKRQHAAPIQGCDNRFGVARDRHEGFERGSALLRHGDDPANNVNQAGLFAPIIELEHLRRTAASGDERTDEVLGCARAFRTGTLPLIACLIHQMLPLLEYVTLSTKLAIDARDTC